MVGDYENESWGNAVFKRKKYKKVKVVIDDNVIAERDPWEIIDPLWWSVTLYEGEEEYLRNLNRFSLPQTYVFAICSYSGEVNNGGHDQFYFNSTGIVWKEALKGFGKLGLVAYYDILKESTERLGGSPSRDRDVRQQQLDKMPSDFDDLDTAYYQLEEKVDLGGALLKYIEENRELFYFEGILKKPDGVA